MASPNFINSINSQQILSNFLDQNQKSSTRSKKLIIPSNSNSRKNMDSRQVVGSSSVADKQSGLITNNGKNSKNNNNNDKTKNKIQSFFLNNLPQKTQAYTNQRDFKLECFIYDFRSDYNYNWYKDGVLIKGRGRFKIREIVRLPSRLGYQILSYRDSVKKSPNFEVNREDYEYILDSLDDAENSFDQIYGSQLAISPVSIADKGRYECRASRMDGRGEDASTFTNLSVGMKSNKNQKIVKMEPRCMKYTGNYCQGLIGHFIYLQDFQEIRDLEDTTKQIVNSFASSLSDKDQNCREHLISATCLYVFNVCSEKLLVDPTNKRLKPMKLCREDCDYLPHLNS